MISFRAVFLLGFSLYKMKIEDVINGMRARETNAKVVQPIPWLRHKRDSEDWQSSNVLQ